MILRNQTSEEEFFFIFEVKVNGPFSDSITPLIEALASQASVAIINRTLLDEHEELKKQLEREVDARTEEL